MKRTTGIYRERRYIYIYYMRERERSLFKELAHKIVGLASLKSVEQAAGRLQTQGRVDAAALSRSTVWRQYLSSEDFSLFS